jgi:hypothetical protein
MMRMVPGAMLLASLAGCAVANEPSVADLSAGSCRNDGLASFVGQVATAELGAQILRQSGAKTLQWVAPGTMVTMDFRGDRVRVYLAPGNAVSRVSCG